MEFNLRLVQDGLLAFRGLSREKIRENNKIFRERYSKEAYYFIMDGIEFITYGKGTEDHVHSKNFENYFEEEFDGEYTLRKEKFESFINTDFQYRVLNESDAGIVNNFKKTFSEKELDMGQVSIDDPVIVGVFDNEKLIAVSSLWYWENDLADIGLIVSSNYRKQGVGKSVVSFIIEQVIDSKIMIYRADYDNPGSVKIAKALGFEQITKIRRYKG